jgi:hypothetical protein
LDLSKNLLSSFPTNSEGSTATAIHPLLPALKWLDLRENRFLSLSRELFELVVTENAPIGFVLGFSGTTMKEKTTNSMKKDKNLGNKNKPV